jgi:hypothetical protein
MLFGKKYQRSGMTLAWLLIGLLVGAGIGAATVYILKPGKNGFPGGPRLGSAEELALVPPDAAAFVHIRARDFWKSDEMFSHLRTIVEKAGTEDWTRLDEAFAPKISTLDRITIVVLSTPGAQDHALGQAQPPAPGQEPPAKGPVMPQPPGKGPKMPQVKLPAASPPRPEPPLLRGPDGAETVGVLTFTEPFDAAKVRATLMPEADSKQSGGKEYWDDAGHHIAAYFPSPTILVIGAPNGVKQFLAKQPAAGAKAEGALAAALEWAGRGGEHIVAAANGQDFRLNLNRLREILPSSAGLEDAAKLAREAEPILAPSGLPWALRSAAKKPGSK